MGWYWRLVASFDDRLGLIPDEIPAGQCVALSHPEELADMLRSYLPT